MLFVTNPFFVDCIDNLFISFFTSQVESHANPQDSVHVSPESSITVKGSSTLHDWDAASSTIQLSTDLPEKREIQFTCTMNEHEDHKLRTTCETEMDMTAFRMKPPTAFFGVLKTDGMVTVAVDLVLVLSKEKGLKKWS